MRAAWGGVDPETVRPLRHHVLVDAEPFDRPTSGIIIPETAARPGLWRGKVLATGPGRWVQGAWEPVDVKRGDQVLFFRYEGQQLETGAVMQKRDGHVHYVIADTELLGVLAP